MKNLLLYIIILAMFAGLVPYAIAIDTIDIYRDTLNGIPVMAGGVGLGDRAKMKAMSGNYNLKVVTARMSGAYMAKCPVTILDDNGKQILHVVLNGPWLYVRLPKGKYTIASISKGLQKKRALSVDQRLTTVMFHWR